MCCAISSTAAASRGGSSDIPAMRRRTCSDQSCMLGLRDPAHRLDERAPRPPPRAQRLSARRGEAVVAPPPLRGLLDPTPFQEALRLEPVEEGIERGDVEPKGAVGAGLDELADLIAVARPLLDQGEDQELRGSLLEL